MARDLAEEFQELSWGFLMFAVLVCLNLMGSWLRIFRVPWAFHRVLYDPDVPESFRGVSWGSIVFKGFHGVSQGCTGVYGASFGLVRFQRGLLRSLCDSFIGACLGFRLTVWDLKSP